MAAKSKKEVSVYDKLKALYNLQAIDSQIDKIRTIRGELPLEVQDLEDELEGLETRLGKMNDEVGGLEKKISDKKNTITDAKGLIKKYESQQTNVRNNREYDSLNKEIEFQKLEIQLAEKRIKEYEANIGNKVEVVNEIKATLDDRKNDLNIKKGELDGITAETEKEEKALLGKSKKAQEVIDERLVKAYQRIRTNARNGLAVVPVSRDACGGCFNKIPPQRQMDIKMHKKVIVCEHCGRLLVDDVIVNEVLGITPEPAE